MFGFKNIKITGGAASADQEAIEFPDAIYKIIEEKEYMPKQVLMQTKYPILEKKKKSHKGHLLVKRKATTKI